MPEHQAAVAGLVPAPLGGLHQPLDLAPGEVLPVAVVPARVSAFAPVHHFVEVLWSIFALALITVQEI